jgi:hypothetical protein
MLNSLQHYSILGHGWQKDQPAVNWFITIPGTDRASDLKKMGTGKRQ